jgi:hypothetical protein
MFHCNILCAWFCIALLVYSACLCNRRECGKPLGEGNTLLLGKHEWGEEKAESSGARMPREFCFWERKIDPMTLTIDSCILLSHVRKSARHRAWRLFRLLVCFDYIVGSRHLVFNWGLLGNLIYWSCQRFIGKELVVVREGISTPNAPYLR